MTFSKLFPCLAMLRNVKVQQAISGWDMLTKVDIRLVISGGEMLTNANIQPVFSGEG